VNILFIIYHPFDVSTSVPLCGKLFTRNISFMTLNPHNLRKVLRPKI